MTENDTVDLDTLLKMMGDHAHRVLLEIGDAELKPVYHIIGDESLVIGCAWRDETEKLLMLKFIKGKARELNATMMGFVCEMWMSKYEGPNMPSNLDRVVPPSQDPNRLEGVIASVTDGTETKVKCWQIIRSRPGGNILALAEQKSTEGMFSGRMIDGLLPNKKKPH
jgi:hypothetical protein